MKNHQKINPFNVSEWDEFTRKFDCSSKEEELSVQSMPDNLFAYGTHMTTIMTNKLRAKLGREVFI